MAKRNVSTYSSEFAEWDRLRAHLAPLFKVKDVTRTSKMDNGMQLLARILEGTEGAKPMNFKERFEFINSNKSNYIAFYQLDELFKEAKKKIAAISVRK